MDIEQYLCNTPFPQLVQRGYSTFGLLLTQQNASSLKRLKYFSYRVTVVERVTKLLQAVEVLDIVFGLVGCISDPGVQFPPRLHKQTLIAFNVRLCHTEHYSLLSKHYIEEKQESEDILAESK